MYRFDVQYIALHDPDYLHGLTGQLLGFRLIVEPVLIVSAAKIITAVFEENFAHESLRSIFLGMSAVGR